MEELEELRANIERLKQALNLVLKHGESWEYKIDIVEFALKETPEQSLRAIKRAAVDEFCEQYGDELTCDMTFEELDKVAEMYTKTLSV